MISIVIPCYNCEKTLYRAVDSIINQATSTEWELILINDGSTDSTGIICDRYSDQNNRIKSFHQMNMGLMRSWKNGVEYAQGEYIAFCDADDFYEEGFLERVEKCINEYHPDIYAYGMVMDYDNHESTTSNNHHEGFYDRSAIETNIIPELIPTKFDGEWTIIQTRIAKVYTKALLKEIIPLLPDYVSQGEDNLTTLAAVMKATNIYSESNYAPYHYVRNSDSMIGRYDEEWFSKLTLLNRELKSLAQKVDYPYVSRIDTDFLFNTLIYLKKEIMRSGKSISNLYDDAKRVRESKEFEDCIKGLESYEFSFAVATFARLLIDRHYLLLVFITRMLGSLGVGKP